MKKNEPPLEDTNYVSFRLSPVKNLLMLSGALIFVAASVFIWFRADSGTLSHPAPAKAAALAGMIFFGALIPVIIRKLFDKKPGLVLDESGIVNNTTALGLQHIPWQDITGIESAQVRSTKFLLIYVVSPEKFIRNARGIRKWLLLANLKTYGTPVSITANALSCKFAEVVESIRLMHEKYGGHPQND